MTTHRTVRKLIGATLAAAFVAGLATPALAGAPLTEAEATNLAVDAYLYFYPAVTIDVTRRQLTNVAKPAGFAAPTNTFGNVPAFPTADMKAVVAPNFDTLYSSGVRRSGEGADGADRPRYGRALLSDADAGRLERRVCFARFADHRYAGRQIHDHRAGLDRHDTGGSDADQGADAGHLDHRPHQDRWPIRLRGGPQDPGWLQVDAAVEARRRRLSGPGGRRQFGRRHEGAAEGNGRAHGCADLLRRRRRSAQDDDRHTSPTSRSLRSCSAPASCPGRASISARRRPRCKRHSPTPRHGP